MCDLISIAVPASGANIMSQWRRRKYALTPQDNPSLKRQLPADFCTWVLTTGGCSCDLCPRSADGEQVNDDNTHLTFRDDAAEILQELAAGFDRVFVYVHFYNGDFSTEQLPATRKERRKMNSPWPREVFRMDTLVELSNRR